MNLFRLVGDLSHLASIFILLQKITKSRSARGISFKTQALYVVVFVTRYVDLFTGPFISVRRHLLIPALLLELIGAVASEQVYNTLMKLFFIGSSGYILYLMRYKYRPTQDPAIDTFRLEYLLGPCAVLSLIFNYKLSVILSLSRAGHAAHPEVDASTVIEILWAFSIYLEAVAILPQLFILQRTGEAETITTHYLFALGLYRAMYIPNWIYRSVPLSDPPRPLAKRLISSDGVNGQVLHRGHGRPHRDMRRARPDRPLRRLLLRSVPLPSPLCSSLSR